MIRGQYDVYQSMIELLGKSVRKHKLGRAASIDDCINYILAKPEIAIEYFEQSVLASEYYWRKHSRVVMFPDSIKTIERIKQVKLSIQDMELVNFPHESFYLAFPKDYKIAGLNASGCLVNYMGCEQIQNVANLFYNKFFPNRKVNIKFSDHFLKGLKGIVINYITPTESKITHARVSYDSQSLTTILKFTHYSEYAAFTQRVNSKSVGCPIANNSLDAQYEFELIKIVVRIGIYTSISESALSEGFPSVRPKHLEPKGIKYNDFTLKVKGANAEHYRSWYIRQLMDKRYYKNEHASKPIGSRLIFVSSSHDDLKIEPETLT